ncbi:DUF1643 domain-containing protein [Natronolimnohabitans sp. A-GB9]|uniref:DUF1643 domain-containing protein n=1 Tax=Natronolimnohabitans sp. A-GB9 TaxID=3069757 RepID=UPI0027AFCE4A|nr:DUF1643 domain-containing protein [Natronolimnohabitans sp. A-GB9]MDQ2052878.1 DUF1643 domain-containing protein [Natronolimnohabitans sp. A-GB9]
MLNDMEFDGSKGTPNPTVKTAEPTGQSEYRYWLTRKWDNEKPLAGFVGINPSTADEKEPDQTLNNCKSIAYKFGFGGVVLVNLFAVRDQRPSIVKDQSDPVGPNNDEYLQRFGDEVDCAIAAWGTDGEKYPDRVQEVKEKVNRNLWAIYLTDNGCPKHLSRYEKKKVDPVIYYSN